MYNTPFIYDITIMNNRQLLFINHSCRGKYETALNLIRTVPGFDKNPLTAIQVFSKIGSDMSVFPTTKHLVS